MAYLSLAFQSSVVAVLLLVAGVMSQSDPVVPSFSVTPSDTTAVKGIPVTIYCSIADLGIRQVFWSVEQMSPSNPAGKDFTLGPNANTHSSYPRFAFVGDHRRGEYNLKISNVSATDIGVYTCLVHDPNNVGGKALETPGATLTVVDSAVPPTSGPQCSKTPNGNSQGVYQEGETLTLSCSSTGGSPHPQLSWVRINANNFTRRLESRTAYDGSVVTVTSTVTLSSEDHLSFYECIQAHPAVDQNRKCSEPSALPGSTPSMNVRFKPSVTMSPSVINIQAFETSTVELRCQAYANPPLTSGPSIILPPNKPFERVDSVDMSKTAVRVELSTDDLGKDFHCRASNEVGLGEASIEIRRLGELPTWMVLVIIAAVAMVCLIFITVVGCATCVDRSGSTRKDKEDDNPHRLRYSVQKSRPTSLRHEEEENQYIDGFQGEMVPIEDFQGGQENVAMQEEDHLDMSNDFETGEKGPRYQNVNEALHSDSTSYNQSYPSSSEPIIDPNSD